MNIIYGVGEEWASEFKEKKNSMYKGLRLENFNNGWHKVKVRVKITLKFQVCVTGE